MDGVDVELTQMMQSWLDHGGTRLVMKKLNDAADLAAEKYDEAVLADDREATLRIAVTRWFIKEEIPRIIETMMNPPHPAPKRWSFWSWFKLRVTGG